MRFHAVEIAREQRSERFRIRGLAHRRRAGDVTEEHSHRLALLARRGGRLERRGTVRAELEGGWALWPQLAQTITSGMLLQGDPGGGLNLLA